MAHPGDADGSQEAGRPETNGSGGTSLDSTSDTPSPEPRFDTSVSATPEPELRTSVAPAPELRPDTSVAPAPEPGTATSDSPAPEPRGRIASIPMLDVVLDPRAPNDASAGGETSREARAALSPERTALYGLLAGLAVMAVVFAVLIVARTHDARTLLNAFSRALPSAKPAASAEPAAAGSTPSPPPSPAPGPPSPAIPPGRPIPGPWRLSQMAPAPDVKVVEGAPDRRAVVDALADSGVPRAQVYRLLNAFNGIHKFDKPKRHDSYVVALQIPTRRIRAFEYQVTPTEIYQAKENDEGTLVGERIDLHVEKKRAAAAVVVGDDLASSLQSAGFDPSLVDVLDDALEGRAQLSSLRSGSRLRIVVDYETALGVFAHYIDVLTVEYTSIDPEATPLRVYRFHSDKAQGFFDAKGHQPYKGGFRTPIPFARISSRFNMRRMHPILHVVMPHNGVDFVAASGTPVYAASSGNIEWIGDGGPSGNLVTIRHGGGITTGYAHLSRFAPRLAQGQPVETRQLVGYVGSTGRSTGPHLHFSAKRNGVFIDPLALKLDGDRVLPKSDRAEFEEQRTALDKLLESIPLPSPPPEAVRAKSEESDDLEPLEEHSP